MCQCTKHGPWNICFCTNPILSESLILTRGKNHEEHVHDPRWISVLLLCSQWSISTVGQEKLVPQVSKSNTLYKWQHESSYNTLTVTRSREKGMTHSRVCWRWERPCKNKNESQFTCCIINQTSSTGYKITDRYMLPPSVDNLLDYMPHDLKSIVLFLY